MEKVTPKNQCRGPSAGVEKNSLSSHSSRPSHVSGYSKKENIFQTPLRRLCKKVKPFHRLFFLVFQTHGTIKFKRRLKFLFCVDKMGGANQKEEKV
jgi:hypothetical protein